MKVFLTGSTGYIGGTIAVKLLAAGHRVVGLVRSKEREAQVRELGLETIVGSLDDAPLLTEVAAGADVVINAAQADHRPAVEAILAALRGSSKPFIHTSGAGIVADCAGGVVRDAVYEDDTPVHPLPLRVARVSLDNLVRDAAKEGVRTSVISPTMVYGRGLGIKSNSIQIPRMIVAARTHCGGKYVGQGSNIWSNVHIDDLGELYLKVLDAAPAGAFYYAENGENSMIEISQAISRMLGFGGQTTSMTIAEAVAEFGEVMANYSFGSNVRVRAVRAHRELGWSGKGPALLDEIERGSYFDDAKTGPA